MPSLPFPSLPFQGLRFGDLGPALLTGMPRIANCFLHYSPPAPLQRGFQRTYTLPSPLDSQANPSNTLWRRCPDGEYLPFRSSDHPIARSSDFSSPPHTSHRIPAHPRLAYVSAIFRQNRSPG